MYILSLHETFEVIFYMNIPESKFPRIVIIGGGFAGVNLVKS
ncbi:MAG: NADH dehydrogenase, partial [Psychroserpens sp.]